jgi:hypothetical protein
MPKPTRFASDEELTAMTIRPAIPAQMPLKAYMACLIRFTGTPERRAASALPPIASSCRPKIVRLSTHVAKTTIIIIKIDCNGMPKP